MFINYMVGITLETCHLPEDTKAIKEDSTKFSSKIYYHVSKISSFSTFFDERLDSMSSNNIVGRKIETAIS